MAKKYVFKGLDRQATALLLLAKLGPSVCWHHQLMQWAKDGSGLHGAGPVLLPIGVIKGRPIYARPHIDQFIVDALHFDSTLGPGRALVELDCEVDAELLHPMIPYRVRRIRPHASVSGAWPGRGSVRRAKAVPKP